MSFYSVQNQFSRGELEMGKNEIFWTYLGENYVYQYKEYSIAAFWLIMVVVGGGADYTDGEKADSVGFYKGTKL